jgi:hypothetical protein
MLDDGTLGYRPMNCIPGSIINWKISSAEAERLKIEKASEDCSLRKENNSNTVQLCSQL